MASTYSSDLKLELMATGENAGTWGDKTNTNLNLVQQAVAGFEQVTLSSGGTLALAMSDGALSNARNLVIKFATATIAASTICTIPDSIEKFYIFDATGLTNPTNLTIKTASGTGFTLDAAKIYAAYSDGTNLNEVSLDTLGGTVAAAQIADGAVTTDKIGDDQVTFAKMQDTTTNNRVLGAVSAGTIGEVQVAQDMIANDAVGPNQLADTSVSAGSYTVASITVDAQGRLTAASSGQAGGGMLEPKLAENGPGNGTYTATSNANYGGAIIFAGGGGGGGGNQNNPGRGGRGGQGGFGYYGFPIGSHPFAKSFSLGAGGNGGAGNSGNATGGTGNAGSASNLTDVGTVNGGGGAPGGSANAGPGNPGNAGTAPGATNTYTQPNFLVGNQAGGTSGFGQGGPGGGSAASGSSGEAGGLFIFENTGS